MFLSAASSQQVQQTELINIPDGAAGTRATLKIMARLVRETRIDQQISNLAASLVQDIPGHNFTDEARRCFEFVRDSIRYLKDTNGVEVVRNPLVTLSMQAGDCDDMVTLLAALLESIGHRCRFIAVGYTQPGDFEHVYLETKIGGEWFACDPTMPVDFGWAPIPPNVVEPLMAIMVEHI